MLRETIRDAMVYTLPTIVSRGLGFITLPIYGRVLSRPDFGVLDLVLAIGPIVGVIAGLEIHQGLSRLRVDADTTVRQRMTGTTWLFNTAGYVLLASVTIPAAPTLASRLLGDARYAGAIRLGVVAISMASLFNLILNQLRWELRSRTYAVLSSMFAIVTLLCTLLLTVVAHRGLEGVLTAQCIAGFLGFFTGLLVLHDSWRPVVDFALLKRMLYFSLPLIPASLSVFLTLYFNRLALKYFGDLTEVADYGMAARVAGVVSLLIVGMQSAVTPLVYQHYREPQTPRHLSHLFSGVVGLCLVLCLGLNAFSTDLLYVVGGDRYQASAPLVCLVAPALLMGQLYVFAPGMALAMRTRAQLGVAAAAAVADIIANLAMVPPLGALGAAISTLASSTVFLVLWIVVSQRHYSVPFEFRRLAVGLLLFLLASIAAAWTRGWAAPLSPWGLIVKLLLILVVTAALYRTGMFSGIREGLRDRVTDRAVAP